MFLEDEVVHHPPEGVGVVLSYLHSELLVIAQDRLKRVARGIAGQLRDVCEYARCFVRPAGKVCLREGEEGREPLVEAVDPGGADVAG